MPGKTSLRDKLDEEVLDLSLMQLNEVPVTEIVSICRKLEPILTKNMQRTTILNQSITISLLTIKPSSRAKYFSQKDIYRC